MTEAEFVPKVERDEVPSRSLGVAAVVALVVVAVAVAVAAAILRGATPKVALGPGVGDPTRPHVATGAQIGIVEQTLILDTRRGLDERAEQEESLRRYGWVDRARGVARIPIDQAMDLVTDPAFVRRAFVSSTAPDATREPRGDGGP